jgi:hypothetical protein
MMWLTRKIRLWLWDAHNADTLALAVRRQTIYLGNGRASPILATVIRDLTKQRNAIAQKEADQ